MARVGGSLMRSLGLVDQLHHIISQAVHLEDLRLAIWNRKVHTILFQPFSSLDRIIDCISKAS